MTVWELRHAIQGSREAMVTGSWMAANYQRAKRLPPLKRELERLRPVTPKAVDPMGAAIMMAGPPPSYDDIAAVWGA